MKSYTLASERLQHPLGAHMSRRCFGCIGFVGLTAEHLATTSWAHGSRTKTTQAYKFLPTVSGIQSRRSHLICASRGKPAKPKTFWERRSRNET